MKILYITNMYPNENNKYLGIHVKEQIDFLQIKYNIKTKIIFIESVEKGRLEYLKSIPKIVSTIKRGNYDIVHIHYGLAALFLLSVPIEKKIKDKMIITLHGGDILKKQGKYVQNVITKTILRKIKYIIVLNNEMMNIVGKKHKNVYKIPCGVDTEFFREKSKNNYDSLKIKTIIFPGDPEREVKNYKLYVKVLDLLKENSEEEFKSVVLHGYDRDGVKMIMQNACCLTMTSISEGSPQVIKEALACNIPVVSTPVGDVEDVLENIPYCKVVEKFDEKEIAAAIIGILETEKIEGVRESFLDKKLDQDSITEKIYNLYKKSIYDE